MCCVVAFDTNATPNYTTLCILQALAMGGAILIVQDMPLSTSKLDSYGEIKEDET